MINVEDYNDLMEGLWNIYKAKNADYGDSFKNSLDEFGRIAFVVRASDKMERLKQLMRYEVQVKDESINDTVQDLALYCIMYLLEYDHEM